MKSKANSFREFLLQYPHLWFACWAGLGAWWGSPWALAEIGEWVQDHIAGCCWWHFTPGYYRVRPSEAFIKVPLAVMPFFIIPVLPLLPALRKGRMRFGTLVPLVICLLAVGRVAMFKLGARGAICCDGIPLLVYASLFLWLPSAALAFVAPRHGLFTSGISALAYMPYERHTWYGFDTEVLIPFVIVGCFVYVAFGKQIQRGCALAGIIPLGMMIFTADFDYLPQMGVTLLGVPVVAGFIAWYMYGGLFPSERLHVPGDRKI